MCDKLVGTLGSQDICFLKVFVKYDFSGQHSLLITTNRNNCMCCQKIIIYEQQAICFLCPSPPIYNSFPKSIILLLLHTTSFFSVPQTFKPIVLSSNSYFPMYLTRILHSVHYLFTVPFYFLHPFQPRHELFLLIFCCGKSNSRHHTFQVPTALF